MTKCMLSGGPCTLGVSAQLTAILVGVLPGSSLHGVHLFLMVATYNADGDEENVWAGHREPCHLSPSFWASE